MYDKQAGGAQDQRLRITGISVIKQQKSLAEICKKHNNSANCLQSRVTRVLLQALNNNTQGLAVHYGALAGLIELGQECITSLVLPQLKKESQYIDAATPSRSHEHQAATKITHLLQRCVAPVFTLHTAISRHASGIPGAIWKSWAPTLQPGEESESRLELGSPRRV